MITKILIDYLNRPKESRKERLSYLEKHIVSRKFGIIKEVVDIFVDEGDPPIFISGCSMTDTSRFIPLKCNQRNGGAGLTREDSRLASIGEGIERYCSAFYTDEDIIMATYDDFKDTAVEPERFQLFHERQYKHPRFPYVPFTNKTKIAWTKAYSLITQKEVLVPAAFVFMPYLFTKEEAFIGPGISTGLSCHDDLLSAAAAGINECVERDSFIISWLHQLQVPVLSLEKDKYFSKLMKEIYFDDFIDYSILDITLDIPLPSILLVGQGDSTYGPLFCVGSAARAEYKPAIQKCLIETAQGRPFLRYLLRARSDWEIKSDFSNLENFDDHAVVYTRLPELVEKVEMIKNRESRLKEVTPGMDNNKGTSVLETFNKQIRIFKERGFDIIVKDLTTPDVYDFGLRAVKVICPDLCQLHGNHNLKFFGGKRLYELPYKLGLTEKIKTPDELFPYPHPFP